MKYDCLHSVTDDVRRDIAEKLIAVLLLGQFNAYSMLTCLKFGITIVIEWYVKNWKEPSFWIYLIVWSTQRSFGMILL